MSHNCHAGTLVNTLQSQTVAATNNLQAQINQISANMNAMNGQQNAGDANLQTQINKLSADLASIVTRLSQLEARLK